MRATLIRLTNVVLFTMACWLFSVVFNQILAERLQPRGIRVYAGEVDAAQSAPDWNDRKVIIDRNLFGAKVSLEQSKPPPAPLAEEPEEVEETKLPLELLGTLWSSDTALSTAAIRDSGKRLDQVLLVGDFLEQRDGVKVAAIERGRVILLNGSRREELLLYEDGQPKGGEGPASASAASPARNPVAGRGVSRPSRSSDSRPRAEGSTPATRRRAARVSRARAKAKRRTSSGAERLAEMNELSTGREPVDPEKVREQEEVGGIFDSMIGAGASPEEIFQRMKDWEMQKAAEQ